MSCCTNKDHSSLGIINIILQGIEGKSNLASSTINLYKIFTSILEQLVIYLRKNEGIESHSPFFLVQAFVGLAGHQNFCKSHNSQSKQEHHLDRHCLRELNKKDNTIGKCSHKLTLKMSQLIQNGSPRTLVHPIYFLLLPDIRRFPRSSRGSLYFLTT